MDLKEASTEPIREIGPRIKQRQRDCTCCFVIWERSLGICCLHFHRWNQHDTWPIWQRDWGMGWGGPGRPMRCSLQLPVNSGYAAAGDSASHRCSLNWQTNVYFLTSKTVFSRLQWTEPPATTPAPENCGRKWLYIKFDYGFDTVAHSISFRNIVVVF